VARPAATPGTFAQIAVYGHIVTAQSCGLVVDTFDIWRDTMTESMHPRDLVGLAGAMRLDLTTGEQDVLGPQLAAVVEASHSLRVPRGVEPAVIHLPGKGLRIRVAPMLGATDDTGAAATR
jgi:hypothetical protein